MRHVLSLFDLTSDDLARLFTEAAHLKAAHVRRIHTPILMGRTVAMVFEKPSLRTRVSFEAAVAQLGGASIFLSGSDVGLGSRESVPDVARTVSRYVDAVVLRTYSHQTIEDFAAHSDCPVINGLSEKYHPCQAVADVFTVQEIFGDVHGRTIAFIGDGNNVARSLAVCCGKLGMRFVLAAPRAYQFDREFTARCRAEANTGELIITDNAADAVTSADVIYTDVWTSMGQEAEKAERTKHFASFQVNDALLAKAPAHAKVMHCLPAHRGEEITSEVLDSERSVVFQQAANRMHAQKAILLWLMG